MNVWVIRVPVIDGDPIELGAEIGFHLPGEIARESFEVGHLTGVLGGDDEAEMMPVVLAAIREGYVVSALRGLITEGVLGAILTGLMVLLFLRDLRSALIVVVTIPFALALPS